jgi:acyl-CoA thioesterase FadM
VRNRSFILSFGVFHKGMDELIGDGQVVLVWLDYGLGRAVEIPPAVRKQLQEG